jgi:MFS family permease
MANIFKPPCDESLIRSAPSAAPCAARLRVWILAATIIGSSMAFIDGSAVNVALPIPQADLNATVTDVQWIVELAALLLVGGSLGDRFGRRRIFSAGVALFALASVWCGWAPDARQLIVARAVQGVGGALLVPGSLAIISASFSDQERDRAIGTWSGFTAITAALGPVLGGWLVENISWRWVFYINVPLAVVVLIISFRYVPESRDETKRVGLDWWGALLATVGLGGVVYGLIESANAGFEDPVVLSSLIGGALALITCVVVEWRTADPMVPLHLFRSPTFSGANLLTLLLYAALGGALFRRGGLSAFDLDSVSAFAMGQQAGVAVRRQAAADGRSSDCRTGLRSLCRAGHRGRLLDHILSRRRGPGIGHGCKRGTAIRRGHGRGRAQACRHRFGHQQRHVPNGCPTRYRGDGGSGAERVQPEPGCPFGHAGRASLGGGGA